MYMSSHDQARYKELSKEADRLNNAAFDIVTKRLAELKKSKHIAKFFSCSGHSRWRRPTYAKGLLLSNGIKLELQLNDCAYVDDSKFNTGTWRNPSYHPENIKLKTPDTCYRLYVRSDLANDDIRTKMTANGVQTDGKLFNKYELDDLVAYVIKVASIVMKHDEAYWVTRLSGLIPDLAHNIITGKDFYNAVVADPLNYIDGADVLSENVCKAINERACSATDNYNNSVSDMIKWQADLLKELAHEVISGNTDD